MKLLVQSKVCYLKCVSFPDHHLKKKKNPQTQRSVSYFQHSSVCGTHFETPVRTSSPFWAPLMIRNEHRRSHLRPAHRQDQPPHIWKRLAHTSESPVPHPCTPKASTLLGGSSFEKKWRNRTRGGKLQSLPGVPGLHEGVMRADIEAMRGIISDRINYYWIIGLIMHLI